MTNRCVKVNNVTNTNNVQTIGPATEQDVPVGETCLTIEAVLAELDFLERHAKRAETEIETNTYACAVDQLGAVRRYCSLLRSALEDHDFSELERLIDCVDVSALDAFFDETIGIIDDLLEHLRRG